MPIGRVSKFYSDRGFGFLSRDSERGADVFVTGAELRRGGIHRPVEGLPVVYAIASARDGRSIAVDVELLKPRKIDNDDD